MLFGHVATGGLTTACVALGGLYAAWGGASAGPVAGEYRTKRRRNGARKALADAYHERRQPRMYITMMVYNN